MAGRFWTWWVSELAGMIPAPRRPARSATRRFVVAVTSSGSSDQGRPVSSGGLLLLEERGDSRRDLTPSTPPELLAAAISLEIAALQRKFPRTPVVVRLPRAKVFTRSVRLPRATIVDAHRILALELEQATPFRSRDCLLAHRVLEPSSADRSARVVPAEQVVVRRADVADAVAVVRRAGLEPDRIDCWAIPGAEHSPLLASSTPLDIDFLAAERPSGPARPSAWTWPLAVSAAGLAAAVVAIAIFRLDQMADDLETRVAAARARHAVQEQQRSTLAGEIARSNAIVGMKIREGSRVSLLETLTRLLPDTDYLSTLRIEGSTIEISGYSASTAALVPLIERSGTFGRAMLTAPVTFDDRAGRERFTMKAEVSPVAGAVAGGAKAATGGGPAPEGDGG